MCVCLCVCVRCLHTYLPELAVGALGRVAPGHAHTVLQLVVCKVIGASSLNLIQNLLHARLSDSLRARDTHKHTMHVWKHLAGGHERSHKSGTKPARVASTFSVQMASKKNADAKHARAYSIPCLCAGAAQLVNTSAHAARTAIRLSAACYCVHILAGTSMLEFAECPCAPRMQIPGVKRDSFVCKHGHDR